MGCKWLSDDFTAVCVNADCPVCADVCAALTRPEVCRYYEEAKDDKPAENH